MRHMAVAKAITWGIVIKTIFELSVLKLPVSNTLICYSSEYKLYGLSFSLLFSLYSLVNTLSE